MVAPARIVYDGVPDELEDGVDDAGLESLEAGLDSVDAGFDSEGAEVDSDEEPELAFESEEEPDLLPDLA